MGKFKFIRYNWVLLKYFHFTFQVSFLIPPEIVPGRMTLLVTLFLVLINIYNNVENKSPVSNTTNFLSLWMLICILFVFGSLSVYAAILLARYKSYDLQSPSKTAWLKIVDISFLIIFPILFALFNVIYWTEVLKEMPEIVM